MFVCPSALGGINWQATAYHPDTNALYASTNNVCNNLTLNEFRDRRGAHHGSARIAQVPAPNSNGQIGQFVAMDLATGEPLWTHRQRAGIAGSVLTTGGGLVFVTDDARRFRAFDASTGDILWGAAAELERRWIPCVLHARRGAVRRYSGRRRHQLPWAHPGDHPAWPRQHLVRVPAALV